MLSKKEQDAKAKEYTERFIKIILDTTPTNRERAEAAMLEVYDAFEKARPTFVWAKGPSECIELSAQHAFALPKGVKATKQQRKDVMENATFGSLEAFWVSEFVFAKEVDKSTTAAQNKIADAGLKMIKECGLMFCYDDICFMSPKPTTIRINENGDPIGKDGDVILEYAEEGTKGYLYKRGLYPSLAEVFLQKAADEGRE